LAFLPELTNEELILFDFLACFFKLIFLVWEKLIFYGSLLLSGFRTFVDILFGLDFDFEGFLTEFECIQRLLVIRLIWVDHANDWAFGVFAETFLEDSGKFGLPVDDKCITFLTKYGNDFWEG
jgi:hypothetical protein